MALWRQLLPTLLLGLAACAGGGGTGSPTPPGHPLDHLDTALVEIRGELFQVWLARTSAERSQGLQGITAREIAPLPSGRERGMLFIWSVDTRPSFWMKGTIVPLDLAYIRSDGVIMETHALVPLDETSVPAGSPVRYALEVRRGVFESRGIVPGDVVGIPPAAGP